MTMKADIVQLTVKNVWIHKYEDQTNSCTTHHSHGRGMIAVPEFPLVTIVGNYGLGSPIGLFTIHFICASTGEMCSYVRWTWGV